MIPAQMQMAAAEYAMGDDPERTALLATGLILADCTGGDFKGCGYEFAAKVWTLNVKDRLVRVLVFPEGTIRVFVYVDEADDWVSRFAERVAVTDLWDRAVRLIGEVVALAQEGAVAA